MISKIIGLQAYGYMKYELNGYRLIEYNMFVDHERKWKGYQRLPVTSPHGNFATVTSPQKLRHTVTSPHFEKVKGDVGLVGKCVGCGGRKGRCGKRYERRCRKV